MPRLSRSLVLASALVASAAAARVRVAEASRAWAASPLLRATSTAAPADAQGFTIHLFNSKEAQKDPVVKVRPLYKKTFKCRNANPWSCVECFGGSDCLSLRRDGSDGSEYLYIEANSSNWKRWRHHRVRVNLHCPETAEFAIAANVTVQGWMNKVGMCVDGVPTHAAGEDSKKKLRTVVLSKTWHGSYGRIVEVDMHVRLRREGWARVNDMVVHMSSDYLTCQDHTACLRVLEQSSEGVALRNSNTMQLQCLDGSLQGNAACGEWKACLDKVGSTDRIRTLLMAAGVSESPDSKVLLARAEEADDGADDKPDDKADDKTAVAAGAAGKSLQEPSAQEPLVNPCIDPRIDDPESWLCSCMDRMEDTCSAIRPSFQAHGFSTQDCITAQMCLDPNGQICSAWKEDVGCNGTQYGALKAVISDHMIAAAAEGTTPAASSPTPAPAALLARAQRRAHRAGDKSDSAMDTTLSGKATVCT